MVALLAILAILSILGFFVCVILVSINLIRKRSKKKPAIGILISLVVLVVCFILTPVGNDKQTANTSERNSSSSVTSVATIEYDKLQNMFLSLAFETTEEDLCAMIEENGLEYTEQEYYGTPKSIHYKIAYEKDVARQKHADDGDFLEVSFNKEDGTFMYAEYFSNRAFMTAILYSYGTYWSLNEATANNDYSGYYYHKPGDQEGGITIQYSNGNSSETGYHSVATGEDAIGTILRLLT